MARVGGDWGWLRQKCVLNKTTIYRSCAVCNVLPPSATFVPYPSTHSVLHSGTESWRSPSWTSAAESQLHQHEHGW